jgi:SAM-dependent methyltransferase
VVEGDPLREETCLVCGDANARERFVKLGRSFLECRGCGFVWVSPRPEPDELQAYYADAYAKGRYIPFADADDVRKLIARHRFERVRAHARPGRWLDVGCSTGNFVAAAAAGGMQASGIDISPAAVEQGVAQGLALHASAVEAYDPPERFDTITAFDLLEHVLDPRATLERMRSWLAEDGTLVMTLPDVSSIYPRLLMRRHWFYYYPDEHFWYFDPRTIRRVLEEQGFQITVLARATKPMTLDYGWQNLKDFNKTLGTVVGAAVRLLPKTLRARPIPLYVGELEVTARRT